jgi:tetratricopeptide (TPR) repeat protein
MKYYRNRSIKDIQFMEGKNIDEFETFRKNYRMSYHHNLIMDLFCHIFLLSVCIVLIVNPVYSDSLKELNQTANRFSLSGMWEEAIAVDNQILEIEPNNSWTLSQKAFLLGNMAKWEDAVIAIDQALSKETAIDKIDDLWRVKGYALIQLGRSEEAIEAIDNYISLVPNINQSSKVSSFLYQKGIALKNLGRYQEAINVIDQALELNPKNAEIMNEKGVILINLKRYDEALETFNQTLKINPYFGEAKKNKKIAETKINE